MFKRILRYLIILIGVAGGIFLINLYADIAVVKEYSTEVEKALNKNKLKTAIDNIEILKKVCKDEETIKKYEYELVNKAFKYYNYYDTCVKYLIDLGDYKDSKELLVKLKYNYAVHINKKNEQKSYEIFTSIKDYEDSNDYIAAYELKHKFDGTYFLVKDGNKIEKYPSTRIRIKGLKEEGSLVKYQYNTEAFEIDGINYTNGRYDSNTIKVSCNEDLNICKAIYLNEEDENGNLIQTYNEKSKNIYKIITFEFSEDKIIEKDHYVTKKDEDITYTYIKESNDTSLPKKAKEIKQK